MNCPACGTLNKPGAKFCAHCGTRLAMTCPNCGSPVEAGELFCVECGAALRSGLPVGDQPARPAPGPVAERRLVSVLFADLVGFTTFAEGRDAEDTRQLLSRYFDLARDVIERYGGAVEKFIGDAVMAVWGAPLAREDDAERAVRAALELVDGVRVLGPGVQARAGVLTGEAAVTIGATNQGMVAGDLVNTASRLQSVAMPGTVLVGEATQRAASLAIAFEPAGDQLLKGKSSPVPAWRAMRVVAERGGRNRREILEAPFVGRDDEFRLLKELFHATGREKRIRLVSVVGPGGIGKTRLAWEFLKYVDGLVETVWWHDGRSPAYGDGISFWALGEMVRERCGLVETDDEPTTRAKVAQALAEHVPDPDERRWVEPALLTLLGFENGVASEQLFGAWRTFFERLAASAPVVMVFEDFHFADAGLIDFVDHLLEWSRNVPICVVTLARPELLQKRPTWGAGKRNFHSIYLEPLAAPAMRQLLAGLVPGLPETAVRAVVARADGVPLYAVETVRMLVAEGKLEQRDGSFVPVGDLTSLAVPETLTALIASRLDALDPGDRALLQDAAVLGQSFTPAGVAAVSGISAAEVEPRLRSLVRRELLTVEADPRSPERGQYAFVQALIREVGYNMLARGDRKTRHLAAARFFESLGSDELAGALAGHYLAAYRHAQEGPEADALGSQARVALRGAAERASALGSHDQAEAFLQQALTVTHDPAETALLHERAAAENVAVQRFDDAETHYRAALEVRRSMGDASAEARTTATLGGALLHAYRFQVALTLLEDAATRFASAAEPAAMAELNSQLARAYFLNERHARAVEVADRVLGDAERLELPGVVADTLVTYGSSLVHLGRPHQGIGLIEAGRKLAAAEDLHRTEHRALNNLASFMWDIDPRAGLEAARTGLEIAHRFGERQFNLLDNACSLALRTGEWDWALSQLEPALEQDLDPLTRAIALANVIGLRTLRGEEVSDLVRDVQAVPTSEDDPVRPANMAWIRATLAFTAGDYRRARAEWHEFARIFPQGFAEARVLSARCALLAGDSAGAEADLAEVEGVNRHGRAIDAARATLRAGIAALDGRTADALSLYRDALRTWRDLGLAWEEALCAIDMASLLDPGMPEVRAAADPARAILVRLRARPFLERLDAAMARSAGTARPAGTPRATHVGPPGDVEVRAIDGGR